MVDRYQPFGLLSEADDEEDPSAYLQLGGGGVSSSAAAPAGYDALGRVAYGMTGAGGVQDAAGLLGGPSLSENLASGNKLDALLQAVGVAPVVGGAVKGLLGGAKLAMAMPAASAARALKKEVQSISGGLIAPERARASDPRLYHYGLNENQKLSRPIEEMFATYKPAEGYSDRARIAPEFFDGKNASLIPAVGDRTRGGVYLDSVLGQKLQTPTELQAGHEFQYGPAANGIDKAAWASAPHVIKTLAGRARSEAAAGFDPYLAYSAMHGTSADFSHHITDPILDLIRSGEAKVSSNDISNFDQMMRERTGNGWAPYGDFPGLLSDNVDQWLFSEGRGKARTKMAQIMSQADMAKRGFPDVPALRFATMDLGLLDAPPYGIGRSITKLDRSGKIIDAPVVPHKTYQTQIGADPNVGYVGGFKYDIPPYVSHKDWMDKAVAENPGRAKNPSALIKKFVMEAPATRMTPATIDRMSKYIAGVDKGNVVPPGVGDPRSFLWGSPYY